MKDLMKELAKKKKEGGIEPKEKSAKMSILDHIKSMADGALGDEIKGVGLKKVTVASDSAQGLKSGLAKAGSMVEDAASKHEKADSGKDDNMVDELDEEASENPVEEAKETPKEEALESEVEDMDMSDEEIDHMIKMLQEKKVKKV